MQILQVSQFFKVPEGTSWEDLTKVEDEPVLLTEDKKHCLWTETPKLKEVKRNEYPSKGEVWYKKGKKGLAEIYKANYDTSD